ncbi:MAG TPA: hypothetical protein VGX76_24940, partial [Pirellulales bacterium]|nr:hypothetical protein [Pirellulales bacterium]
MDAFEFQTFQVENLTKNHSAPRDARWSNARTIARSQRPRSACASSVGRKRSLTLTAQVNSGDALGRRPYGQVTFYDVPAQGPPVALGSPQLVSAM